MTIVPTYADELTAPKLPGEWAAEGDHYDWRWGICQTRVARLPRSACGN